MKPLEVELAEVAAGLGTEVQWLTQPIAEKLGLSVSI